MNPISDVFYLVRLQVPDEVPANVPSAKSFSLLEQFLHIILTDIKHPGIGGSNNKRWRKRLGHRNECNLRRVASVLVTSRDNPAPNSLNVLANH
jgi:hypothetical protein